MLGRFIIKLMSQLEDETKRTQPKTKLQNLINSLQLITHNKTDIYNTSQFLWISLYNIAFNECQKDRFLHCIKPINGVVIFHLLRAVCPHI